MNLPHPDPAVCELIAAAWDEGHAAGWADGYRHGGSSHRTPNPHHIDALAVAVAALGATVMACKWGWWKP